MMSIELTYGGGSGRLFTAYPPSLCFSMLKSVGFSFYGGGCDEI